MYSLKSRDLQQIFCFHAQISDVSNLFVKKVGRGTKYSFANNPKPASTPLQRDTH
jgi:hypothetical protein